MVIMVSLSNHSPSPLSPPTKGGEVLGEGENHDL
jgi:hypothetical protein